jgi:tetratricopeptide (TPR) repeat protein/DNA-binding CsgD family transcriptional regulator
MKSAVSFLISRLTIAMAMVFLLFFADLKIYANQSIDSLKTVLKQSRTDTAALKIYSQIGDRFTKMAQHDSALFYYTKALELSEYQSSNLFKYIVYNQLGLLFTASGNYSISLEYYFKMLSMLDAESSTEHDTTSLDNKYAGLYVQMGTCYFFMENLAKSLEYYQKSLEKVMQKATINPAYKESESQLVLYINMGSAHLSGRAFDKAQANFEKALEMSKPLNNQIYFGVLFNNLGIVYKEKKDYEKAFDFYNKALQIRKELNDSAGMAQVYNNLGDCYYLTGDYKKSIDCLEKALTISRKVKNIRSQMKAANFLSLAHEKVSRYSDALEMHRLYKQLHDSIINTEQIQASARLELQYHYEKQRKENELKQEIALARKERKALIYMIIAAVLLFSFIIVILLNRNQRIKMKQVSLIKESLELEQKNLNLEKQNLILEKQNLQMELEYRNKELATHVMYLVNKNEFLSSVTEKLLAIRHMLLPENKVIIQEIIREMKSNIDNTVWNEFEVRFQNVHQDFYQKLGEKYPDLTPNETKLCAFLRLNMTTKDISAITFQSVKSILVARARLRKKIGINRDENLVSILQQL